MGNRLEAIRASRSGAVTAGRLRTRRGAPERCGCVQRVLQELRVAQTGVQLLTGFWLNLPFQQRFIQLDGTMRTVYLATVAYSLGSTVLLIAPVGMHRVAVPPASAEELGVGIAQLCNRRSASARSSAGRRRSRHLRHRPGPVAAWIADECTLFGVGRLLVLPAAAGARESGHRSAGFVTPRPGEPIGHVGPTNCAPHVVSGFHRARRGRPAQSQASGRRRPPHP